MSKVLIVMNVDDEWIDKFKVNFNEIFADITLYKTDSLRHQCDYQQRIYKCWCPVHQLTEELKSASEYPSDEHYLKELAKWKKQIDDILGSE